MKNLLKVALEEGGNKVGGSKGQEELLERETCKRDLLEAAQGGGENWWDAKVGQSCWRGRQM